MTVVWERHGQGYFASVADQWDNVWFYLAIESSDAGWDWVVWQPRDDWRIARSGVAGTVQEAMLEADKATGFEAPRNPLPIWSRR